MAIPTTHDATQYRRDAPSIGPARPADFDTASFHAALLRTIPLAADDETVRREFRKVGLGIPKTIGVGNALRDGEGNWDLRPNCVTGRCPRRDLFLTELGPVCQSVYVRKSIQIRKISGELEATLVLVPIDVFGEEPEVLLLVSANDCHNVQVREQAAMLGSALQIWKQTVVARSGDWKLASLAAVVDLTARIESATSFDEACRLLVHEFARYTGCPNVAIGWNLGRDVRVRAIAGETTVVEKSATVQAFQQTLLESRVRRAPGHWSFQGGDRGEPLLLVHKHLAHVLETEAVVSWPLEIAPGRNLGSWVFAGPEAVLGADRLGRLLAIASPRIASALALVERSEPSRPAQWVARTKAFCATRVAQSVAVIAVLLLAILFIPYTYRVRCSALAQPELRRFAVAPFEGQIEAAFVRPGDRVTAGQVLARLDGRNLRWQLNSAVAQKEQAVRKREVELAAQRVSEAMLAELETENLDAQISILEAKMERLEIKSPIDGIVLSGSLDRAEAASVALGESLFEVGSFQPVKLELAIPAEDVGQVRVGQNVQFWMEGSGGQPPRGKIARIRPVSETRLARNVFVAELVVDNADQSLRPGMMGAARIDGDRHALG